MKSLGQLAAEIVVEVNQKRRLHGEPRLTDAEREHIHAGVEMRARHE
jgi:hypothetical protein